MSNFYNKKQVLENGDSICNAILEYLDIQLTAHFGNCVSITGVCKCEDGGTVCPFALYNSTANIGFILKKIFELLELSEEDGKRISQIKNIPCRLIFEGSSTWGNRCIGIGSFLRDKFIYNDDLMKEG